MRCAEGRGSSRHMWCAVGRQAYLCAAQWGEQAYLCGAQRGEGLAGVISIDSRLISTFSGTGKLLVHNVNMCWSIATAKL